MPNIFPGQIKNVLSSVQVGCIIFPIAFLILSLDLLCWFLQLFGKGGATAPICLIFEPAEVPPEGVCLSAIQQMPVASARDIKRECRSWYRHPLSIGRRLGRRNIRIPYYSDMTSNLQTFPRTTIYELLDSPSHIPWIPKSSSSKRLIVADVTRKYLMSIHMRDNPLIHTGYNVKNWRLPPSGSTQPKNQPSGTLDLEQKWYIMIWDLW